MSHRIPVLAGGLLACLVGLFIYLTGDDPSRYLVFSSWGTVTEVESFQRLINDYNATRKPIHPVKLSFSDHTSYTERLLVQAAARSTPDVIHLDQKDLPQFVRRGLCDDLTPYLAADTSFHVDRILPDLVPACRVDGHLFGIPHNFSTFVVYFNKDHFDAEGIPYPDSNWTWKTFRDAARRLTKRDRSGAIVRYGCMASIIGHTFIYQNGGRELNSTLDSCVIASPEAEEAVQFLVDLSEKDSVSWSILAQNLLWDDMFAGGRLSMLTNGRWAAAWYMRSMPSSSVDVAPLPRGKLRRGAAVNHMMTIARESTKKDEAWEFIKYLLSDRAQRMFNEDGANIPAVRAIAMSDDFLRHRTTPTMNNGVFLDELKHSVGWPFPQGPYLTQHSLQSETEFMMQRILLGQMTTRQSLRIMQDNIDREIATQRRVPEARSFVGSALFYLCGIVVPVAAVALWMLRHKRILPP
jgi:multiple sugar transport system substrate-binding protein